MFHCPPIPGIPETRKRGKSVAKIDLKWSRKQHKTSGEENYRLSSILKPYNIENIYILYGGPGWIQYAKSYFLKRNRPS